MLSKTLIALLVLLMISVFPLRPHSRSWSYRPTAGLGLLLAIVVALHLLNVI
jgi:Protein of unknown function (DUF3309)